MRKRRDPFALETRRRRRRFSPLALIGVAASLVVVLAAGVVFIFPRVFTHAASADADPNANCTLIVPANPLSAKGLATPYQLLATNNQDGPCNEANTDQSAFVQSVIYNPSNGKFSVYNPLVIDKGTKAAVAPVVPTLPKGAIVGIWFGFNATNLLLQGAQRNTLSQAHCVNGLGKSLFTQFAYCNAVDFFNAVNRGIASQLVVVPPLQKANDGLPCPTVRDFSVIDQDQSDNVQTEYISLPNGQIAQFSAANQAKLTTGTVLSNPSDNALLSNFIDPALGCKDWQAPNLADNGALVSTLALDELQAAADQKSPIALVPINDPMTTIADGDNNLSSLAKTNIYRAGVDQTPAINQQQASGAQYCTSMITTGLQRVQLDMPTTIKATTPDDGAANSLFTFLAGRLQGSFDNLNCAQLTHTKNPVTTTTDANGVVTSATFNTGSTTPTQPNCSVNGQVINGCTGQTTINGKQCSFTFDKNADVVTVTCSKK